MSKPVDIRFEGLAEVLQALDGTVSADKVNKALRQACLVVERRARQLAPKGNRHLRDSITHKIDNYEGIVFTPLEYAPYVEYGTGIYAENGGGRQDVPWVYYDKKNDTFVTTEGMHPHPFMRPALDENREEILRILREGILPKND